MIKQNKQTNSGFIALMSAVIVSMILLLIAVNTSKNSFLGRLNILNSEFKERSLVSAEACADVALLKLASDMDYTGNENIIIGSGDICAIKTVDSSEDPIVIYAKSDFQHAITNLRIKANKSNLAVVSWEEL